MSGSVLWVAHSALSTPVRFTIAWTLLHAETESVAYIFPQHSKQVGLTG